MKEIDSERDDTWICGLIRRDREKRTGAILGQTEIVLKPLLDEDIELLPGEATIKAYCLIKI